MSDSIQFDSWSSIGGLIKFAHKISFENFEFYLQNSKDYMYIESPKFSPPNNEDSKLNELKFCLKLYPNGFDKDDKNLIFTLNHTYLNTIKTFRANIKISILNNSNKYNTLSRIFCFFNNLLKLKLFLDLYFSPKGYLMRFTSDTLFRYKYISKEDLYENASKFLPNNTLTLLFEVTSQYF